MHAWWSAAGRVAVAVAVAVALTVAVAVAEVGRRAGQGAFFDVMVGGVEMLAVVGMWMGGEGLQSGSGGGASGLRRPACRSLCHCPCHCHRCMCLRL